MFLHSSSLAVFIDETEAKTFLRRVARSNRGFIFEEIKKGDRERECVEEVCSYEEAYEISDNKAIAVSFSSNLCLSWV